MTVTAAGKPKFDAARSQAGDSGITIRISVELLIPKKSFSLDFKLIKALKSLLNCRLPRFVAYTSMAASVIARRDKMVRMGSSLRECRNGDLVAQLPDKKEWIADHKIEMLMLDG